MRDGAVQYSVTLRDYRDMSDRRDALARKLDANSTRLRAGLCPLSSPTIMVRVPLAQRPRDLVYFLFFAVCLVLSRSWNSKW